jgi:CRISPR-associated protein Cas1
MQLVINTRGSYLRKKRNCFLVKNDEKVFEVSANKVDSILIATSAYISTDAIKFAVENNIDIVFLDYFGDPYGRVWHSKLGSTTLIRRRQLEIYETPEGLRFAKEWVVKKINNQIETLKLLKKNRKALRRELDESIREIEGYKERLKGLRGTVEGKRQTIIGLEGMASRRYLESISKTMPKKFMFAERSRTPAKDEFNCMLNYAYGVLYSMVEKACIIAGLDPYVGFIHADSYNKKSLVFDIIEPFRFYADRTVIKLFTTKRVKEEYFDKIPRGLSLNMEGKAILIGALNETFDKTVPYSGRNVKAKNTIQMECHRIANRLIGKD